jgi:hypothetical protein
METEQKKRGVFATLWESMTKTGGCCGSGGSCCGPSTKDDNKTTGKKTPESETKKYS